MSTKLSLACFFAVFSVTWCFLEAKTIVFTGEILKIQSSHETNLAFVRVLKLLLSDEPFPSVVRLRNLRGDSLWKKKPRTVYVFFVVPRITSKGYNLTHYWAIEHDDFKEFQSGTLEGMKFII